MRVAALILLAGPFWLFFQIVWAASLIVLAPLMFAFAWIGRDDLRDFAKFYLETAGFPTELLMEFYRKAAP